MSKNSGNTEITAQAAHDMRAPFAVIKHFLKKENFLNNQTFHSAFERFEMLMNELRPTTTAIVPKAIRKLSFQEIILRVVAEKQIALCADRRSGISISENLFEHPDALYAPGFDQDLVRVVSNLLDNAIEASIGQAKARIDVCMNVYPGLVEVKISDNGVGLPEEVLAIAGKIPFSIGKIGGSGRGLFHARRVIEHLDGELHITNNDTHGATVSISLPILH